MNYHNGDVIHVTLEREALAADACVGHLPDETMVVVFGAPSQVGSNIEATIVGYEETFSGKSLVANATA